ncbi:glycosyltransferase [Spiribacter sp. 221]|uniref:glycosyltransferase n=1 Tax=Spiribacter onubensis TaxID=3122420 RepID=UPI00349F6093
MLLEEERPDITFEVVESRGAWEGLLRQVSSQYGPTRNRLNNVTLTNNTNDMRPVYQRARLLLAPSLWWEAYGRVIAEAHMNGIPTIATNRGGLPEATGNGGFLIDLPDACYSSPYKEIPSDRKLMEIINLITQLHDNEDEFNRMQAHAKEAGTRHNLEKKGKMLEKILNSIMEHKQHET